MVTDDNLLPDREKWHGTANGYSYHACRCQDCTIAQRHHMRKYRQAQYEKGIVYIKGKRYQGKRKRKWGT